MESRIQDLEAEIKREAAEGMEAITAKDAEINILKDSFAKVMADYDELMLSKSDLESEIRTYRKLLEGEEDRLAFIFRIQIWLDCYNPVQSTRDGLKQIVESIEKRAKKMSVNNSSSSSGGNNAASMMANTSYSGSTAGQHHTSGAVNIINTYKQPLTTHSTSFEEDLNAPAPIKSFSHFARKFSTKLSSTTNNKPYYTAHTSFNSSSILSCQANTSSLANKSDSLLDSSASSLSNYSALFSR